MPSVLTPSEIWDNPTLLMRNRNGDVPIGPFDGIIAAVIDDGRYFVTSPNAKTIPQPPLGARTVVLRADFRYGDDDWTLWPQPWTTFNCHYGSIRRNPPSPDHDSAIMWWNPQTYNFAPSSPGSHLGKLAPGTLQLLQTAVDSLMKRVKAYEDHPSYSRRPPIFESFVVTMGGTLTRLQSLATSYRQTAFGATELQRYFHEVTALLDYMLIYKPRMDGKAEPPAEVEDTIGAFTSDPRVVQEFYRAGLPVWFTRPVEHLEDHINILAVTIPVIPKDTLVLKPASPPFPTVYVGSASDHAKTNAIHHYSRSFLWLPDPFKVATSSQSTTNPTSVGITSAAASSTAELNGQVPRPPRNRGARQPYPKSKPGSVGRDKFTVVKCGLEPLPPSTWSEALRRVDRSTLPTSPGSWGYIFPDPNIFLGPRGPIYLRHWNAIRDIWVHCMVCPGSTARALVSQEWRDLLSGTVWSDHGSNSSSNSSGTKAAKRRGSLREALGNCAELLGISNEQLHSQISSALANPPSAECTTPILWELYELNFRFEFLALDRASTRVTSEAALERQDLITACFPDTKSGTALFLANLDYANVGLGSSSWQKRLPWVLRLQSVMTAWEGLKPQELNIERKSAEEFTEKQALTLESTIVGVYTQNFFNHFGRAAMIPRGLT